MMLTHRRRKQIIYGFILLALPLMLVFGSLGVYTARYAAREEAANIAPNSQYLPIKVEATSLIPHAATSRFQEQSIDIVTPLRNLNARAGVPQYTLEYVIYNTAGQEVTRTTDTVYLLPGALQYAMILAHPIPAGVVIGQVEVTVTPHEQLSFVEVPDLSILPNFSTFLRDREERIIAGAPITNQTGIVTNAGTFPWQRVEVRAVALDPDRNIIAAGKTFAGALETGEQREFTIQWPKADRVIQQVVAVPTTNIFRDDNFIQAIGDPATLR